MCLAVFVTVGVQLENPSAEYISTAFWLLLTYLAVLFGVPAAMAFVRR